MQHPFVLFISSVYCFYILGVCIIGSIVGIHYFYKNLFLKVVSPVLMMTNILQLMNIRSLIFTVSSLMQRDRMAIPSCHVSLKAVVECSLTCLFQIYWCWNGLRPFDWKLRNMTHILFELISDPLWPTDGCIVIFEDITTMKTTPCYYGVKVTPSDHLRIDLWSRSLEKGQAHPKHAGKNVPKIFTEWPDQPDLMK